MESWESSRSDGSRGPHLAMDGHWGNTGAGPQLLYAQEATLHILKHLYEGSFLGGQTDILTSRTAHCTGEMPRNQTQPLSSTAPNP